VKVGQARPPQHRTLIVGLGNPGPTYARTRHNVGFRVVQMLASRHGIAAWRSKCGARIAQAPELDAVLAMPQTFMNDSGDCVAPLAVFFKIDPAHVLVICDDFNLDFGQLRMRRAGSDGGHNGLKSIVDALHTEEFPRLRVGVGRRGPDAVGFVLGMFSSEDEAELARIIDRAADGAEIFAHEGIDAAIAAVNAAGGRGQSVEDGEGGG